MDWSVCKRRAADAAATEQAVTLCLYYVCIMFVLCSDLVFLFPNIRPPSTPSDGLLLHTNHRMVFYAVPVAFMLCVIMFHLYSHSLVISSVSACVRGWAMFFTGPVCV